MFRQRERRTKRRGYRVQIVQVRPDKLNDFIELYRDEINPALRQGGVPWRSAWRTGQFGNTYERQFITPLASFADLDGGGTAGPCAPGA